MIQIISHRGLLEGPNQKLENNLNQILKVLEKTSFGVEVDLRYSNDFDLDVLEIGHCVFKTEPFPVCNEKIQVLLKNPRALIHCKDEWTAVYMREKYPATEIFDHDREAWAETSKGRKIAHFCGIFDNAIWNQPEKWYENGKYAINSSFENILETCLANKIKPCAILTKYPYEVQRVLDDLARYYEI